MATFYYNRFSDETYLSQWRRHLYNLKPSEQIIQSVYNSNRQQTHDYSAIISLQTKEINGIVQNATKEQIAAMQQSTTEICGTLESGFELLSDNLHEISYEISGLRSELNDMASMLDWKLSLLIEQQKITNLLLGNIAILLRIPDFQKERHDYIEKGIGFLKKAFLDNDLYENALKYLLKAEEKEAEDFFVLHRIGLIYMYSPTHLELSKAEEYFKKAAKYAIAETSSGIELTTNYLKSDININLLEQNPTIDSIKVQAAEAYLFAGRSCYLQGKLDEAADYASKGFKVVPQMVEAGFVQAQALALNNKDNEAVVILEKVINTDIFYSLKVLSDPNLFSKPSVLQLLKKLQVEATQKGTEIFEECKQSIIPESRATNYLNRIKGLINKKTFLSSKRAIKLLQEIKKWNYCEPFKNQNQTHFLNEIIDSINTVSSLKHYKANVDKIIAKANTATQWTFPNRSAIESKSSWKSLIESKTIESTLKEFILSEKKLNDNLPNATDSIKKLCQEYSLADSKQISSIESSIRKADDDNLNASIGVGILGGLGGGVAGFVVGFILGLLFEIGSCTRHAFNSSYEEKKYSGVILIICVLVGVVGGFISSYSSKRNK